MQFKTILKQNKDGQVKKIIKYVCDCGAYVNNSYKDKHRLTKSHIDKMDRKREWLEYLQHLENMRN